jgi:hypothetical protein
VQVRPAAQLLPHVPQCAASLDKSMQPIRAPQSTCPFGQAHAPLVHVAAAGQVLPQVPQLVALVDKSTQPRARPQ